MIDDIETLRPDPRLQTLLQRFPEHVFSDTLFRSSEWVNLYCRDLALHTLNVLGILDNHLEQWYSLQQWQQQLTCTDPFKPALSWLLDTLYKHQLCQRKEDRTGDKLYRIEQLLPTPQLARLRQIGLDIDPANAATLALLDNAAQAYPAIARGQISAHDALLNREHIQLWLDYFNNQNPLYAANNWISAIIALDKIAHYEHCRILEIGAGSGSAAQILLRLLQQHDLLNRISVYRVSEPQAFFRRRSERLLRAEFTDVALEFVNLDINQPWQQQGIKANSFDLVYCVNVLHVADDLAFSLQQAQQSLADGYLIAGECLRPDADTPVNIECVFQLLDSYVDVQLNPLFRPNPGFLCAADWRTALAMHGFTQIGIDPDPEQILALYKNFMLGVISAKKSAF